ncbi:MAG: uncharacterized protein QG610_419 [Euryarchaeota archaeon]|nr:uncharacterized protein [Euryarchaeota archaeon]
MSSNDSADVIKQCLQVLDSITSDSSVPRNIRRSVNEIMDILNKESEPLFLRAASSISILEDVSNDPKLPLHTRTLIWNLSSQLETIPVDE